MSTLKPRLYLPIETKRREFQARIYLASKAVLKNWSVVICSKQDFYSKYKLLQPGVVMFKSLQEGNYEIIMMLKKKNFINIALNEEGLLIINPKTIFNKVRQKCLDVIEYFFCWGEIEKNVLIDKFKNINSKLILSGNARVDILKKENRKALEREAEEIKKKNGNFILFTTRYGLANFIPRFGLKNWIEGQVLNGNVDKKDKSHFEWLKQHVDFEKKNLDIFFSFLEKFNKVFPEKKLIIRPHPSENHMTYINEVKKYNNIQVINDDKSTNSWILASEFLISCNCTTSVEAYLLNKIAINFLGFSNQTVEAVLPKILSKNVYSMKELFESINKPSIKNLKDDEYKEVKKWMFNFNDISSTDIILEKLIKFQSTKSIYKDKNSNVLYFLYYKFKRVLRNILNKYSFAGDKGYKQLSNQKMANFNKTEMQNFCKLYTSEIDHKKIKVKEIFPDIFEIVKQ